MKKEIWKPIKGYEELYEINNFGKVKSLRSKKKLKSFYNFRGYEIVSLCKQKVCKHIRVHRLILITFVSDPLFKMQTNHKNGIKSDNRIENLEWVTCKQNMIHAFKMGLCKCRNKKMVIRNDGKIYPSITDAAKDVDGALSRLSDACHRENKEYKGYFFRFTKIQNKEKENDNKT